jgi:hypothetical protein
MIAECEGKIKDLSYFLFICQDGVKRVPGLPGAGFGLFLMKALQERNWGNASEVLL